MKRRQRPEANQRTAAAVIMADPEHWGGRDSLAVQCARMEFERLGKDSEEILTSEQLQLYDRETTNEQARQAEDERHTDFHNRP